jgi:hypothetical protein
MFEDITRHNDITEEINKRIMSANKCYFGLLRHFKSRLLSRQTKSTLYKTLVKPVLTYASETWTLTLRNERALNIFERKILRRIYGPIRDGTNWRRRYNAELYGLYEDCSAVQSIKIGRLRWLGHVHRMNDNEPAKRVMSSNPIGRRRRGRPKIRWLDGAASDCRILGVPNWKAATLDRNRWRELLEEARTHTGLSRP